ncbi:phosphatidylinositol-4-phosphate 5-kinase type-1 gamma, partial [Clonorchis sinensis]
DCRSRVKLIHLVSIHVPSTTYGRRYSSVIKARISYLLKGPWSGRNRGILTAPILGSISAFVFPSGNVAARCRNDIAAERDQTEMTSDSRAARNTLLSLGQPDSIPALVPLSVGVAARHRKDVTAERSYTNSKSKGNLPMKLSSNSRNSTHNPTLEGFPYHLKLSAVTQAVCSAFWLTMIFDEETLCEQILDSSGIRETRCALFHLRSTKPTSEIQQALQLGIQHHIGSIQKERDRDVLYRDFQTIDTVQFPACGTKTTPAHSLSDFRFKTYAPIAFRNFRTRYKLDIRDFLNSICSRELRELSNPGASGSIFYITQDDEFIIKTVQHREGEFLRALLPSYFMNLWQHPPTLLPKFHGFYCYQTSRKNIRFVVMNNLLPSSVKIHEKYDLKGSTHKRRASAKELAKSSPTLKDLDFIERHPDGIWLEAETYDALMRTIEQDCLVLESLEIMDYSLLLGVHNLDQAKRERVAMKQINNAKTSTPSGGDDVGAPSAKPLPDDSNPNGIQHDTSGLQHRKTSPLRSPGAQHGTASDSFRWARAPPGADGEKIVTISSDLPTGGPSPSSTFERDAARARSTKRLAAYCTAMESIEASAKPVELEKEEMDLIPSGGIPARNSNGDRLLLFLGIIDILQSYRLIKKLEHGFKAIAIDGNVYLLSGVIVLLVLKTFQVICSRMALVLSVSFRIGRLSAWRVFLGSSFEPSGKATPSPELNTFAFQLRPLCDDKVAATRSPLTMLMFKSRQGQGCVPSFHVKNLQIEKYGQIRTISTVKAKFLLYSCETLSEVTVHKRDWNQTLVPAPRSSPYTENTDRIFYTFYLHLLYVTSDWAAVKVVTYTFDLLKPPKEEVASSNQKMESYYNRKHIAKCRYFDIGQSVLANDCHGNRVSWRQGKITRRIENVIYDVHMGSSCKSVERSLFANHPEIECVASEHFDRKPGHEQRKDDRYLGCGAATRSACVSTITKDDTQKTARQKTYTTQLQRGVNRRTSSKPMKQASSKRAAPPGRLPTIRSSDVLADYSNYNQEFRRCVIKSRFNETIPFSQINANQPIGEESLNAGTPLVPYEVHSHRHNFEWTMVQMGSSSIHSRLPGVTRPAPQLRIGHYEADTVSHPTSEFDDSTGGPMGPNRHGQQEYGELSTARRHGSSCELNLRSGTVQYPSLPPNTYRGSTGRRNSSNRLTAYQRNARSHTQLNQCSRTRTQKPGHIPTHVLNELIPDLDRSASHLSVASILTTSSESDGSDRQHASRSSVHSHLGEPTLVTGRCIVTPEHPRVVYISDPDSKLSVDVTPKKPPIPCNNHRTHTTGSPNQELRQVVNGVPKTESQNRYAKRTEMARRNPPKMVFDSLPTSLIKRRLPVDRSLSVQGNELPAMPASKSYSGLTGSDSLEYFMQDAVLRFREAAYDPYGSFIIRPLKLFYLTVVLTPVPGAEKGLAEKEHNGFIANKRVRKKNVDIEANSSEFIYMTFTVTVMMLNAVSVTAHRRKACKYRLELTRGESREYEENGHGKVVRLGMAVSYHHCTDLLRFLDSPVLSNVPLGHSNYCMRIFDFICYCARNPEPQIWIRNFCRANFSGIRIFFDPFRLRPAIVEQLYRTIVQKVRKADEMLVPRKPARSRMGSRLPKRLRCLSEKRSHVFFQKVD